MTSAVAAAGLGTATRAGVEVRLENLRRRYAGVTALDGLSLTMAPGELVALLGPSGCGKTTALRLVAGLEQADSGRVVVGGEDVTGQPTNKRDVGIRTRQQGSFEERRLRMAQPRPLECEPGGVGSYWTTTHAPL